MYRIREEARLAGLTEPIVRDHTGATVREVLEKAVEEFQPGQRPSERTLNAMVRDLDFVGMTYHRFSVYRLID